MHSHNSRRSFRRIGALLVAALLVPVLVSVAPAGAQTGATPVGYVDMARAADGGISVAGWTYDPDAPAQSNWVHVYVDGAFVAELGANRLRQDVNDAFGISGRHGFGAVVAGGPGDEVCIYGLGTDTAGRYDAANALLSMGCIVVSGSSPSPAPPPPQPAPSPPPVAAAAPPLGYVDSVESNTIGGLRMTGWAYDPDRTLAEVAIDVYVDDVLAASTVTDRSRPDVNATVGISGAHGFRVDVPLSLGQHVLCAVARGVNRSDLADGVDGPLPVLAGSNPGADCYQVIFYPPECESETDKGDAALLACIDEVT